MKRVIEGKAPVAYATGGGDASPNNSGVDITAMQSIRRRT